MSLVIASNQKTESFRVLSPEQRANNKASAGRLRWIGGNIGLDCPISIDVIDGSGEVFGMGLAAMLTCLADFEGRRGNMATSDYLLAGCFSAYEYGQMTNEERITFEAFVRDKISTMGNLEAARRIVMNGRSS